MRAGDSLRLAAAAELRPASLSLDRLDRRIAAAADRGGFGIIDQERLAKAGGG